jgi:DNA-binding transcriptional MocR family regulator
VEGLTPTQKSVFNTIVIHAETETNEAWPSNQTLADETSLSVRSVQNAIQALLKLEYISIEYEGHKMPNGKFLTTKRIIKILPDNWMVPDDKKGRKRISAQDPAILDGSILLVHKR